MSGRAVTAIFVLLVLGWAAWPYGALWFFGKAVDGNDAARLEAKVDWRSVRDHLKGDVKRRLSAELGSRGDREDASEAIARGAILMLGSVVAEGLIDAYADPKGLLTVLREIARADRGEGRFRDTVSYAFFAAPTSFRVHVKPESAHADDSKPLVLIFTFQDFDWVLTRIKLPLDELENGPTARDPPVEDEER